MTSTTAELTVDARRVNTTAWGCRHTESVRYFVVGDINPSSSYERGLASCAHKTRRGANESITNILANRERDARRMA